MNQQDFEEVINDAPKIVANWMGIPMDSPNLLEQIKKEDDLAANLLEKYIEAYTEWWETSCSATQGEPTSSSEAKVIQRLIDKRGHMRQSLMGYLCAQYTRSTPAAGAVC